MGSTYTTRTVVAIGVAVAVIAFAGGYYFRDNKDDAEESPSPTPDSSQSVSSSRSPVYTPGTTTVKLTSTGLSPAILSIRVGDTVTLRNDSASVFWPASNPHPTHSDCPGFDALRGLNKGESYTLTFTKVQVCGYHNHLDPTNTTMRGTITIR
jgi:plastocyanin